jgi:RNA polymerase sigma-70 factor (ECF subfamily)
MLKRSNGAVGDALAALPERQRQALLLREWQQLSYAEIAEELGIAPAAVGPLLYRARRALAKRL